MFHTGCDLAPDRILAVQEPGVIKTDKELAGGTIGIGRTGHGTHAAHMRLTGKFRFKIGAASAHTGAIRTAALGHKTGNHPVECQTVIITIIGQF